MSSKKLFTIVAMSSLLLLSCINLFGQANSTATLQGTVTDKSQAVVSGADLTVTNKGTGPTRSTKTNASGESRLEALAAGIYNVSISPKGFFNTEAKDLALLM